MQLVACIRLAFDYVACRAIPRGLERSSADRMSHRFDVRAVPPCPIGQKPQGARQLAAGLAELVGVACRPCRVGLGCHESLLLERTESLRKHVRGDRGNRSLEVPEAARTIEQGGDHEQRPAVADRAKGVVERLDGRRGLWAFG